MTPKPSGAPPWIVPEPLATAELKMDDGARIVLRRHGNPRGPGILLSHGNGLAADLYYPFWSMLADRFDLILYDLRNHGWNPPGNLRGHHVGAFANDHRRVLRGADRHFGAKPRIGVFHSTSAVAALHHEPPGDGFSALVLFDPAICLPSGASDTASAWSRLGERARRRQDHFRVPDELAEAIRRSPALQRLRPGVADLYARVALRPASRTPGYELRCPREYEAKIFEHAFAYCLEPEAAEFSCPVKVIGGDPTSPYSFLPSLDFERLVGLDYDFVPETTHFLQIEEPTECAALTVEFLERHGLA